MKPATEELLRKFAVTDGLLKGTALISNLVTLGSISILPGFGPSGLFVANTIQMLVGGALEIPTGIFADRFGWVRSIKVALLLKMGVTIAFLGAVVSANLEFPNAIWWWFATEAVIDAFASAFLSGSYQAAYNHWYHTQLGSHTEDGELSPPPLFVASFNYAHFIRFVIPISITLVLTVLYSSLSTKHNFSHYTVVYVSIAIIFLFRTLLFYRVVGDHRPLQKKTTVKNKHRNKISIKFFKDILMCTEWWVYSLTMSVSMITSLYLMGQIFRLFKSFTATIFIAWSAGIGFGIAVYLLRTLISVVLFPRLARFGTRQGVLINASILVMAGIIALSVLSLPHLSFTMQTICLFLLTIVAGVSSDGIQRFKDSSLQHFTSPDSRATWLSSSSGMGMLVFGAASVIIYKFHFEKMALMIFSGLIALIGLIIFMLKVVSPTSEEGVSLEKTVSNKVNKLLVCVLSCFFMGEAGVTVYRGVKDHHESEKKALQFVKASIEDSYLQGNFVEASKRFRNALTEINATCGKLVFYGNQFDNCGQKSQAINSTQNRIELAQGEIVDGAAMVYLDQSYIWLIILKQMLTTLSCFIICLLLIVRLSKSLSKQLLSSMQTIFAAIDSECPKKTGIVELDLFYEKLNALLQDKKQNQEIKTRLQVAAQVAHDIRSPLAVIKMLAPSMCSESVQTKETFTSATARISEIIQDLTTNTRLPRYKKTISDLLKSIIMEKHHEYRHRKIEFNLSIADDFSDSSIEIDHTKLHRVISNLLNNAVEASNDSARVDIRLSINNDNELMFSIADHGVGMTLNDLNQIGTVGFTKKENGNGLGVSSAKAFAMEHGGQLEVVSQVGLGTSVSLILPRFFHKKKLGASTAGAH